ncbi:MAG: DegT/DnrJ/EryC1/StrS family aminotransferase [Ignavibacteriae bacterium]|nr:DegT/DnrJ/EryC1/StrS family aminotransferase [Ignavibacteriota bacterium]
MKVPFVDLKLQYSGIKSEVRVAMDEVLDNTAYILGKPVANFESAFAEKHDVKFCSGVSSGTDGNHLVLWALGVGQGDEVIIPADTFIATAWGATLCGATPVFVDVDAESYNLDAKAVARAVTPKTKAIVAVHLYGQATDLEKINSELRILNYELKSQGVYVHKTTGQVIYLVEDCAQSHLAEYKGKKVGGLAAAASFSFYPGKNLGAYGEGGAVCTNDEELGKKFKMMREHGSHQKYLHLMYGHNYRMEGLQGAVLGVKLNHLEKWTAGRRQAAEWYGKYLGDCDGVVLPKEMKGNKHVYHLFVVRVKNENGKNRESLMKYLGEKDVASGLHYPVPLHLQPCFEHLGYKRGDLPVTEDLADNCLSLPMFPELTEEQVKYVCECVKEFFV